GDPFAPKPDARPLPPATVAAHPAALLGEHGVRGRRGAGGAAVEPRRRLRPGAAAAPLALGAHAAAIPRRRPEPDPPRLLVAQLRGAVLPRARARDDARPPVAGGAAARHHRRLGGVAAGVRLAAVAGAVRRPLARVRRRDGRRARRRRGPVPGGAVAA